MKGLETVVLTDWIIIAILGFFAFRGFKRGFVSQLLDVIGAIVGLIAAFSLFTTVGGAIAGVLGSSSTLGNVIAFILIAIVVSGVISFGGRLWQKVTKSSPISLFDKLGGSVFGIVKGVLLIAFILLIIGSIPWPKLHQVLEESGLASDIGRVTPFMYGIVERALPASVPRLLITPEGPQLRKTRFSDLNGATCVDCRGEVEFKGFQSRGLASSPKFICSRCGRTSDGCQTFEGYHQIYERCPVETSNQGIAIDCDSWPNNKPILAKGPCPVCGAK
jgi:membrane protein required for colicin V production